MKIGILAFNSVINFGALLQLLSTYMYFKNHGCDPVVINWLPKDLEDYYSVLNLNTQVEECKEYRDKYWHETKLCRTSEDIANIIKEETIQAVVVGSDAVIQHHPFLERVIFPTRRIISLRHITSDRRYPNPFWGNFNDYLEVPVPIVYMSASSQDSSYNLIFHKERKQMKNSLKKFAYISVRDTWTKNMVRHITDGEIIPDVTPDPVFAFNQNAKSILPTRKEILTKYHLKENYILYSFKSSIISQNWIRQLENEVEFHGMELVKLPFSDAVGFGESKKQINLPLSPIDWYCLIKYSSGYIGNNMHPIVVSIHNQVPFFCFDNYGRKRFNGLIVDDSSSKILHIVTLAGLQDYRVSSMKRAFVPPTPEFVIKKIKAFDTNVSAVFAKKFYEQYVVMMNDIITKIKDNL